jgi:hypothetical protein
MRKKTFGFALIVFSALGILFAGFGNQAHAQDRFAIGTQVAIHKLPELGETAFGYGFRVTYGAYLPFLSFDSELNIFPTSSTGNFGETQGFFGLKAGVRVGRWGGFLKLRPGFDHFGGGFDPERMSSETHFALDLGGGVEYYFVPHLGLRWDLSDIMTHFGGTTLSSGPGGPIGTPLGTQQNFQTTLGLVVTF